MNKIIAIAALGLAVTACDPYEDEPGGTPTVMEVLVAGRLAGPWTDTDATDGWEITDAETNSSATDGRIVVVKTNVLLDGTSIEAEPQTCTPADNWLTATGPATLTGGAWYTCYYPGTPTALEGASVVIYYSPRPPSVLVGDAPLRAGIMPEGDYTFAGSFRSKNGTEIPIDIAVTVGPVPAE